MLITLSPPSGRSVTATVTGPAVDRGNGWIRHPYRLGDLSARVYEHSGGARIVWIANALPGNGPVDFKAIRIQDGIHERTIGNGTDVECVPTRRGFVVRLGEPPAMAIPDPVLKFGPLDLPHPKVDHLGYSDSGLANFGGLQHALLAGLPWTPTYPGLDSECGLMLTGMGRWRPLGPQDNAAPGGSDVRFHPGYGQCPSEALLERTRMDCAIERTLHAWDDHADYRTVESYGEPGPQYTAGRQDPNNGELPGYKKPGEGTSACPYRSKLESIGAYDFAHSSRVINPATVAWEYLRDPVAADLLVDLAEEARLAFSNLRSVADPAYDYSLRRAAETQQVGYGANCGRMHGWKAWVVAMADKVHPRFEYRLWAETFMHWAATAQMRNGLFQRNAEPPLWCLPGRSATQAFEAVIFSHGLAALSHRFPVPHLGIPDRICRAGEALYLNRKMPLRGDPWHAAPNTSYGPPHFVDVGQATGKPDSEVVGGKGNGEGPNGYGDPTHAEAMVALCHRLSSGERAEKFLMTLPRVGWPAKSLEEKTAMMVANPDKNWTASSLATAQKALAVVQPL